MCTFSSVALVLLCTTIQCNLCNFSYFQEVLSSSSLPSDINEITLLKDGSWATSADNQMDANTVDTPRKSNHKVEVISDDIGTTISFRFILIAYKL